MDAAPLPVDGSTDVVEPRSHAIDLVDVLLLGFAAVGAFFFLGGLVAGIFMVAYSSRGVSYGAAEEILKRNVFFVVTSQFVVYLAIVGCMAFLVSVRHQTSLFKAIHWNTPDRRRALYAVMTGASLALVADIGEMVLNRWIPQSVPITEYFRDRPSALLLGAFSVLVAPFMEEIVFRGFIYPAFARWMGVLPSIVVTALGFALLHGSQLGYSWALLLVIFVVGVALTVTRVVTKSVATCVIAHMAYNLALFTQTYIQTHGFRHTQGV